LETGDQVLLCGRFAIKKTGKVRFLSRIVTYSQKLSYVIRDNKSKFDWLISCIDYQFLQEFLVQCAIDDMKAIVTDLIIMGLESHFNDQDDYT